MKKVLIVIGCIITFVVLFFSIGLLISTYGVKVPHPVKVVDATPKPSDESQQEFVTPTHPERIDILSDKGYKYYLGEWLVTPELEEELNNRVPITDFDIFSNTQLLTRENGEERVYDPRYDDLAKWIIEDFSKEFDTTPSQCYTCIEGDTVYFQLMTDDYAVPKLQFYNGTWCGDVVKAEDVGAYVGNYEWLPLFDSSVFNSMDDTSFELHGSVAVWNANYYTLLDQIAEGFSDSVKEDIREKKVMIKDGRIVFSVRTDTYLCSPITLDVDCWSGTIFHVGSDIDILGAFMWNSEGSRIAWKGPNE